MEEAQERFFSASVTTVSMGFAWCTFFGARWFFSGYDYLAEDPMLMATVLALVLSFLSFSLIFVLDKIADAEWTGEKADEIIIQIISAIGILVGFAWEQCFDAAVGALSSVSPIGDLNTKVILTLFCVSIIVPAWHSFMLPMVVEEGWKFGFVVTHERLMEAFEVLKEEEEEELQKQGEAPESKAEKGVKSKSGD